MVNLRIFYENFYQELRNLIYSFKNKNFPFGNKIIANKDTYINKFEQAKSKNYPEVDRFENYCGYKIDREWMNDLALHTQVVIKKSEICYAHGRILYSSLSKYINNSKLDKSINILETGTSRGFSSLCMAKALFDSMANGKIITIDYLPHDKKFYWNCIDDHEGKKTRRELLKKWKDLSEKYILFLEGHSKKILKKIKFERINFAFLDASHTQKAINDEFSYLSKFQKRGDIIIFDDYGNETYFGLKIAIDEICKKYDYKSNLITSSSNRGYLIATKK